MNGISILFYIKLIYGNIYYEYKLYIIEIFEKSIKNK